MVQISGNLKLKSPAQDLTDKSALPKVIGLITECRLIESSSSILELSIPQSTFTSTTSLDCTILAVESKYALLRDTVHTLMHMAVWRAI